MKYLSSTALDYKDIKIRKSLFVTKTQFLSKEKLNKDGLVIPSGYCCTITGFLTKDDISLTTVRYLLSSLSPITISHPCFPTFKKSFFLTNHFFHEKTISKVKRPNLTFLFDEFCVVILISFFSFFVFNRILYFVQF